MENSLLFKSSEIKQLFHFSLLSSTSDASDELKSKTFTNPVKVDDDILQRDDDRDKSLDFWRQFTSLRQNNQSIEIAISSEIKSQTLS